MSTRKPKQAALLSKLCVSEGFVWGWASLPGKATVHVHLRLDASHVASEVTGQTLPASIQRVCGVPPQPQAGFCFALPAAVNDGFEHTLQAALPEVDDGGLYGEVLSLAGNNIRGEVQQQARQLTGTVWCQSKSTRVATLRITAADGTKVLYQKTLTPLKQAEPNGYPAAFSVPLQQLGLGVMHISCNGQELRGSPVAPMQPIVGVLEQFEKNAIAGWAFNLLDPLQPIELMLRVDGKAVRWFRPNHVRDDLTEQLSMSAADIGIAGFRLSPPELLFDGATHLVEVVAAANGRVLSEGGRWICWAASGQRYRRAPLATPPVVATKFPPPVVSVVILNRNGAKVLSGMLNSWARYNRTVPVELIVIDHASTDDSLALLARAGNALDLRVVPLKKNDSFSASCNRGAKLARGQFVLFLNNDIEWLQDALPRMLESLQDPSIGIVGMKLLKVVGESTSGQQYASEVQHLGVRFTLNETGYWPYELKPDLASGEEEHCPQLVPVVTGAALLCRKVDFEAIGGFHPDYFYGFEDVELCLRMTGKLGMRVLCRNDCVALHHHGHTRLSGRERSMFNRLQHNSTVLEAQVGLWSKRQWWQSLLSGDGQFTREPLRIGLVGTATELAASLAAALPHAELTLHTPRDDWKKITSLHVLVVGDSRYDIRSVEARADLFTIAYVKVAASVWAAQPWWQDFAAVVAPARQAAKLQRLLQVQIQASSHQAPLGTVLAAKLPRLRVAICMQQEDATTTRRAGELRQALRQQGVACWLIEADAKPNRVLDVCVTLAARRQSTNTPPHVEGGVLQLTVAPNQPLPTAAVLASLLEQQLGSTFLPS